MPTAPGKTSRAAALADPGSFATTLVTLALDLFGTEALAWHPATLRDELAAECGAAPSPANFDRLMAGALLVTTDRFYKSLPDFIGICNILSGSSAGDGWDPADAAECAWGITEALLLGPPAPGDSAPFTEEICRYIGAACAAEGLADPPDVLRLGRRPRPPRDDGAAADPRLAAAVAAVQRAKTRAINDLVRDGLRRLFQQLEQLDLAVGDAAGLVDRLSPRT